jgi:signal peptidase II
MRRLELLTTVAIVAADQLTKAMVRTRFALHDSVEVVPGWLSLTRVHNTGAAFGMFNNVDFPFKAVILMMVALAALAGVAWYAASLPAENRAARLGIALILGGAVGNLIDRAATGYVLDFVDAYRGEWHFWAFNVADAAITVGVGLMLVDVLADLLGNRRAPDPA